MDFNAEIKKISEEAAKTLDNSFYFAGDYYGFNRQGMEKFSLLLEQFAHTISAMVIADVMKAIEKRE